MKYVDDKGHLIYVTDFGSGGRVWSAIYAESGQPVVGIGTHVSKALVDDQLRRLAELRGWKRVVN